MATRKRTEVTLTDQDKAIEAGKRANGWVEANNPEHENLYARWEAGLARRLYEVWRTAGQLTGERWEWSNQSTQAQAAWRAVARAVAGPAYKEHFGVKEITDLMHS